MAPSTQIHIRIQVTTDRATHAQLIAPMLGVDADVLTRQLRAGPVDFGPYDARDARALVKALRCFGVKCTLGRPVCRVKKAPSMQRAARRPGRYLTRFVRRPVRRTA